MTSTREVTELDEAYIVKLVDSAPPLTPDQLDRLSLLLRGSSS